MWQHNEKCKEKHQDAKGKGKVKAKPESVHLPDTGMVGNVKIFLDEPNLYEQLDWGMNSSAQDDQSDIDLDEEIAASTGLADLSGYHSDPGPDDPIFMITLNQQGKYLHLALGIILTHMNSTYFGYLWVV